VTGIWWLAPTVPDTGIRQTLSGNGTVHPLGSVRAEGELQMPGFVRIGHAVGVITLEARGGSITLDLLGPPELGFGGAPGTFRFTVANGTGQYAGDFGSGTATLHESKLVRPWCPPGMLCPDILIAPLFTLTLQPIWTAR
jgi:hypothetical protein